MHAPRDSLYWGIYALETPHRRLSHALAMLPWTFCVMSVVLFGYDAPYWDQWWKLVLIDKAFEGTLEFADYWTLINEHRVFFPNLLTIPLARLTHWNLYYELALTLVFATLSFLVVGALLKRLQCQTEKQIGFWVLPTISTLMFSMSQRGIWMWGLHVMIAMTLLFILLEIYLLSSDPLRWSHLSLAAICATAASYSFGTGIISWPVGFFLILVMSLPDKRHSLKMSSAWIACAAAVMSIYFVGYKSTPASESAVEVLFSGVPALLLYVLAYLGAPLFSYQPVLSAIAGTVALLLASFTTYRGFKGDKRNVRFAAPFWSLMLFALLTAILIALKQWHEGIGQAISSRYIVWPTLMWIGLSGALIITLGQQKKIESRLLKGFTLTLLVLGLLSSAFGAYKAEERHDAFLIGRKALIEGRMDADILYLYPNREVPEEMRDILVRHKLTVFRD